VIIAGSVQMLTLGLIFAGAAVVLLGSILRPRQADPMGMFGLPSVCVIIAGRPMSVKSRTARPLAVRLRCENRKAA
jgi:hypothetical protein